MDIQEWETRYFVADIDHGTSRIMMEGIRGVIKKRENKS